MASRSWSDRSVAVIASGPSLAAPDCETICQSGIPTIAVNSSWKAARFAEAVYAGDMAWWDEYGSEIDIDAERVTCMKSAARKHGLTLHGPHGQVLNSGMRAIQFAIARGAKQIILLGFDCSIERGTHWHGDHERTKNPTSQRVRGWHAQFAAVAAEAKARKVQVINCSRETALTCFPRMELRDAT